MKKIFNFLILPAIIASNGLFAQTVVPNGDFENWVSHSAYEDPLYWDTPNQEVASIPFIGFSVVTKSTDHQSGNYSAKLETKHLSIPPLDIPGFITLGNLSINLTAGTFELTGGVPISDNPTHLQGFYKYLPQGGDSCAVAILLYKSNAGVRDTVAGGVFSTDSTVSDWTPFSSWIEYLITETPDSMNIFAVSSAVDTGMHPGTTLYLDNITLDYTLPVNGHELKQEINYYQDKETKRILVFLDFPGMEMTSVKLYDMMGNLVEDSGNMMVQKERRVISYGSLPRGIYLLDILHSGKRFCKKFFINF